MVEVWRWKGETVAETWRVEDGVAVLSFLCFLDLVLCAVVSSLWSRFRFFSPDLWDLDLYFSEPIVGGVGVVIDMILM